MVRRVKINGERGRGLAVLHHLLREGATGYRAAIEPGHPGQKRFRERVAALDAHDLVVIQRDKDRETLARDGYAGVLRFADFAVDLDTMEPRFRLEERYADPNDPAPRT